MTRSELESDLANWMSGQTSGESVARILDAARKWAETLPRTERREYWVVAVFAQGALEPALFYKTSKGSAEAEAGYGRKRNYTCHVTGPHVVEVPV